MKASAYLVIEPTFRRGQVVSCKVAKMTQGRPGVAEASGLLIRLEVEIPDGAFDPLRAMLDVPEGEGEIIVRTIEPLEGEDTV